MTRGHVLITFWVNYAFLSQYVKKYAHLTNTYRELLPINQTFFSSLIIKNDFILFLKVVKVKSRSFSGQFDAEQDT